LSKDDVQCCFLKKGDALSCHEFAKNITAEEVKEKTLIIKTMKLIAIKGGDRPSSSNYLKAGFLLVAMLLL
jgi:hypothetical protein